MKVGDVYLYEANYYLVGDVNTLGGTCDDCSSRCSEGELIGNILDMDDGDERDELMRKLG